MTRINLDSNIETNLKLFENTFFLLKIKANQEIY